MNSILRASTSQIKEVSFLIKDLQMNENVEQFEMDEGCEEVDIRAKLRDKDGKPITHSVRNN